MTKEKTSSTDKLLPVMVIVSVVLAFAVGVLWQKVSLLETGGGTGTANVANVQGEAVDLGAPQGPTEGKMDNPNVELVSADDHIRGNSDAKVFLIEYSDLECPFCSSFHETAQQAVDEYGGDVAWVYRHFPLDALHPNARDAAMGAECANELAGQDGFWGFIDEVFAGQALGLSDLSKFASGAGVDATALQNCIDSGKYADAVEEDVTTGSSAGVNGTPGSFVVNQKGEVWLVPGAVPFATLQGYIDEALAS